MAFDGLTVAALTREFSELLTGARIYKIAQPETDELLLTCKTADGQYRLLISASASLPLIRLTDSSKTSPLNAPAFCMLLRKHLQNGRITAIRQPVAEFGRRSVALLCARLRGEPSGAPVRLPVELVERQSVAPPASHRGRPSPGPTQKANHA